MSLWRDIYNPMWKKSQQNESDFSTKFAIEEEEESHACVFFFPFETSDVTAQSERARSRSLSPILRAQFLFVRPSASPYVLNVFYSLQLFFFYLAHNRHKLFIYFVRFTKSTHDNRKTTRRNTYVCLKSPFFTLSLHISGLTKLFADDVHSPLTDQITDESNITNHFFSISLIAPRCYFVSHIFHLYFYSVL